MKRRAAAGAIGIFCLMALALGTASSTPGQNQKGDLELRTIHGIVVDKNENPVPGSVVYLLNVKTQSVKTYIADEGGLYRFSGLDPNVDYEVHAEHADLTSSSRTVSSFDSRRDIEAVLRLLHPKKNAK
ncbi:MAG TPA: carboxypeptidase-like regulatory domain-containing protein [Candidatus Acidoferrales bacterium]|jgi:protocatechuate 3,4-dioxygenase beta subunit|nr:carboxypeptidase-like regulatory domain-containing protein [Candidatus Acidoferrales bacterium]